MWKHLILLIIIGLCTGCGDKSEPTDPPPALQPMGLTHNTDGKRYLEALVQEIDKSEHIIITEHSFKLDAYDYEKQKSLLKSTVIYAKKKLSQEDKALFRSTIAELNPQTQDAFPACIFEPHHTISFYRSSKKLSVMQVCFSCGQVEWNGSDATPPWSLLNGLEKIISSLGMHTQRDWTALAKQHIK